MEGTSVTIRPVWFPQSWQKIFLVMLFQVCDTLEGAAQVLIPFPNSPGVSSAEWEPSLLSPPWSWRAEIQILPPPSQP